MNRAPFIRSWLLAGLVVIVVPALLCRAQAVSSGQAATSNDPSAFDGSSVLSASTDGTARLWRFVPEVLEMERDRIAQSPNPQPFHGLSDVYTYATQISGLLHAKQFDELEAILAGLRQSPRTFPSGHCMLRGQTAVPSSGGPEDRQASADSAAGNDLPRGVFSRWRANRHRQQRPLDSLVENASSVSDGIIRSEKETSTRRDFRSRSRRDF